MKLKKTQRLSVGGLMTAFSCVLMLLSNLLPSGAYTFPAAAGIIVCIVEWLAGRRYAWSSFAATSLLAFFLCTNKEVPLCFTLFLGYYPMLRTVIEKIKLKVLSYFLKLLIFNSSCTAVFLLLLYVFSVGMEEFEIFGINAPALILVLFNAVFLVYDYALTLFEKKYRKNIYKIVTNLLKRS